MNWRLSPDGLVWLLSCVLITLPATAETRGLDLIVQPDISIIDKSGKRIRLYDRSYALLVGVSDYTAGWPDLDSIPSELDAVGEELEKHGFEVTKVFDPTNAELEQAYRDFINDYGYQTNNRLLFFFSGHGYSRDNGNKGYLVPADAPDPTEDEIGFLRRSFPMSDLLSMARKIEAFHVLFMFDSCFSGTIFKTRALPKLPPAISEATSRPVRQFITAGSAGEEVPAKSVFTPAFVDALAYGSGDLNGDGYITGMELGLYLKSIVPESADQNPQVGKINDYELSRGDFVFAVNRGRAPAGAASFPTRPGQLDTAVLDQLRAEEQQRQADQDAIEHAWASRQAAMQSAFTEVMVYAEQADQDKARRGLEAFLSSFREDNPFAKGDDDLRVQAMIRLEKIKQLSRVQTQPDVPVMVVIPPGSFFMGDPNRRGVAESRPQHEVIIGKPFSISKFEVSFNEYGRFAQAASRKTPYDEGWGYEERPVINVSWEDAQRYAKWLSQTTGRTFRLPTEAEWEYVARAGHITSFSWGDSVEYNNANCSGCGSPWDRKETAPIGSFIANHFGVYDMHGNVWEWMSDCWHADYRGAPLHGSSWVENGNCQRRVTRGGGWSSSVDEVTTYARSSKSKDYQGYGGIRLVEEIN